MTGPADKTPRLGVAVARRVTLSQLRKAGIPVSVAALNVASIKVTLKKGSKTLVTKTLRGPADTVLRYRRGRKGTYLIVVSGGGKTSTHAVSAK